MTRAGRAATSYVFVSSTAEDLTLYRAAARDAAIGAELLPKMMEYFVAQGDKPPLPMCLDRVSETDVVVVIVAHRYGWVPPDQTPGERKSITWLECERAVAEGKEVLAFLIADTPLWPAEQREEYEITRAVQEGRGTPDLLASVQDRVVHLSEFKKWLNAHGVRQSFVSPEDLRGKVSDSLQDWRRRHGRSSTAQDATLRDLKTLLEEGGDLSHAFNELYVEISTTTRHTKSSTWPNAIFGPGESAWWILGGADTHQRDRFLNCGDDLACCLRRLRDVIENLESRPRRKS